MKNRFFILMLLFSFAFTGLSAVPITLRNNSGKSIPLLIPGVMNPNLSPISNSGVDLKVGQKIYFKHQGKKYVLLEVDESLEGKVLVVNELIRERKKDLGLKDGKGKRKK